LFNLFCLFRHIKTKNMGCSSSRFENTAQHAYGRGFASPVGTEQTKYFTAWNLKADIIHCHEIPKFARKVIHLD
jgi:hypothetical protein